MRGLDLDSPTVRPVQSGDEERDGEAPGGSGPGGRDLAASLEPVLEQVCQGRLDSITWFRTDWQRGGAAPGHAEWRGEDGRRTVLVKMPLHPRELRWLRALGGRSPHVPDFVAGGETLGGYDLAWAVIEHLPHGPLALDWQARFVEPIATAIAGFATASAPHPVGDLRPEDGWSELLEQSRRKVKDARLEGGKEWNRLLRECERRLETMLETWRGRAPIEWIHGDLHPGNAMCRTPIDATGRTSPEVCLIDFAEVRTGHWIEDAIYLERLHWSRPDRIAGHPPVRAIAKARKEAGLDNGDDHARLAAIRRTLMAATAPAYARTEGSPAHLAACRDRIESSLRSLK
jgi:hypothetical protein